METEAGYHFVTDEEYTRKKDGVGRSCPFVSHLSESTFLTFLLMQLGCICLELILDLCYERTLCLERKRFSTFQEFLMAKLKIVTNHITSNELALCSKGT